jgi:hypothetical protein
MRSPTSIDSRHFSRTNRLSLRQSSQRKSSPGRSYSLGIRRSVGRSSTREEYRQIVMQVLGGTYVFQYRYDGNRLVMLRVFHGREAR